MSKTPKTPLRFGFHRPKEDEDGLSFRLSGINLYLLACAVLFFLIGGAWLMVRYTPFSTWVGDQTQIQVRDLTAFRSRMDLMQRRLDAQNEYIITLKQRIEGVELDSISMFDFPIDTIASSIQARIPLDDSLRRRVQRSSMNLPVRTPFILNMTNDRNLEDEYLIPPIRGSVRKSFSLIDSHFGVDIIAPKNSAVKCTLAGLVLESDWTLEGGNTIIVQHENNLISVYKHNSALLKKRGDQVKTGEAIAIIGNTGLHTDGPHVHFELWHDGKPINPQVYIDLENE